MSREREMLERLVRYHDTAQKSYLTHQHYIEIDYILSQPESEPPPADAPTQDSAEDRGPTQDKCPACGGTLRNCIVAIQNGVTCNHWWHKEPAPQQADDEAAKSSDGANVLPSPRQSAADRGPTPETESGDWPTPKYAQEIQFEGCGVYAIGIEEYTALYESHGNLERQRDAARAEIARIKAEKEADQPPAPASLRLPCT